MNFAEPCKFLDVRIRTSTAKSEPTVLEEGHGRSVMPISRMQPWRTFEVLFEVLLVIAAFAVVALITTFAHADTTLLNSPA
jgi:hypothetical protein